MSQVTMLSSLSSSSAHPPQSMPAAAAQSPLARMAPPPTHIPARVASSSSSPSHPSPSLGHATTVAASDKSRSDRGRERTAGPMPTPPHSAGLVAPPQFSRSQSPTRTAVFSPALLGSRLRPVPVVTAPVAAPASVSAGQSHDLRSPSSLPSSSPSAEVMPPLPRALPPSPALPNASLMTPTSVPTSPSAPSRIPSVPVSVSVAPVNIATLPAAQAIALPKSSPASPTSPLQVPPRSKSRATSPSPQSHAHQPHDQATPPHDTCPHDSFLSPSATGSPLCTQCQAPVARLKAMHAAFLDMRDARDELESRLAAREAQLVRIEAEAAKSHARANELEDQADEYLDRALQAEDKVQRLTGQVDELSGHLERERKRTDELEHEKQAVADELEDLSQQLFEQANSMVSTEARRHDQVMRELKARCEAAELAVRDEHEQCVELKRMVEVLERERERDELKVKELEKMHQFLAPPVPGTDAASASSRPGSWASNYSGHYTSSNRSSFVHSSASPALAASPPPEVDLDAIDSYALEDFLDFMSSAPSIPLSKCTSLPFLQRALTADLNPCLAFSAPKAPSAQALVAAMLQGELEVDTAAAPKPPKSPRIRQGSNDSGISSGHEERAAAATTSASAPATPTGGGGGFFSFMTRGSPAGAATMSPTSPPPPPAAPTKCTLCANHSSMPFTLRLGNDDKHHYLMCAFCRDRVVAATDFVAFARNLRAGLFTRQSLGKVWADSLALRSRLGYARLGSLAAVDGEDTVGVGLAKAKSAVANGGV